MATRTLMPVAEPDHAMQTAQAQAWRDTPPPTPQPRAVVCPYCGHVSSNTARCSRCSGRFDPLSRQATQNAMGPWSFIDQAVPTRAGCSYETLVGLVQRGVVRRDSIVRGPTTRQFWMMASRVPGLGHLFGACHSCQAAASPDAYACASCGAVFEVDRDRQHLGVGPVRLLAGQAPPERIAAAFAEEAPPAPEAPARAVAPARAAAPVGGEAARVRMARRAAAHRRRQVLTGVAIGIAALGLLVAVLIGSALSRGGEGVGGGGGSAPVAP